MCACELRRPKKHFVCVNYRLRLPFLVIESLQSVGGTCGYNYITGGVLFKAKGLFGLKNRPLHSASVNKTKSNGTAVKEKQCEQTHGFSGLQFSC